MPLQHIIAPLPAPSDTATYMMRVVCSEAQAQAITDLASEILDPFDTAITMSEIETPVPQWSVTHWAVEIFFESAPNEPMLREMVAKVLGDEAATTHFSTVDQADWVARSLEGLPAVRVGRFVLHGAHDRGCARAHEIALEIEAALAFGTGHHGTTRGCLTLLNSILKTRRPKHILDVGTGTGVLALAAARILRTPVTAGDIDKTCVTAARANAIANNARPWLHPIHATGIGHAALRHPHHFDLVFANILAKPLRQLAPALAKVTARGGQLVLSGLLAGDVAGVLAAYRGQQFYLVRQLQVEGWQTLLLQKRTTLWHGFDDV